MAKQIDRHLACCESPGATPRRSVVLGYDRGLAQWRNRVIGKLVGVAGLFVLAALAEILGCYLAYLWL